ncbi:MAG: hypothetical protein LBS74_02660 [Oscillospiraceae bacterium]|nr:hypothetical protein [Oscillospiraceae bacterium]
MNSLSAFLTYGFMAMLTQNMLFTGGIASSRLLQVAKRRKGYPLYCLLVFIFAFVGELLCFPLMRLAKDGWAAMYLRPLIFAIVVSVLYLAARIVLAKLAPNVYNKIAPVLANSALNGIVFCVPLIVGRLSISFAAALGFAIGAGVGFFIATWLVCEGIERIDNPQVPRSFRGIPASLVYIGILGLAFSGFTGTNIYI